jgi:D-methionine transport system substrate-binding protein
MKGKNSLRFDKVNRRFFVTALASLSASIVFASCTTPQTASNSPADASPAAASPVATAEQNPLKVGVSPVPAGEILEFVVKNLAPEAGLKVEVVTFNDPVQNNTALKDGAVDANYFQHIPFMEDFEKRKDMKMYAFTPQIHLNPVGLFSKKHKSIADIPQNALVTIPDDVSNANRALKVLESAGLIKLKPGVTVASVKDIVENPKNLQIKEIPGAQAIPTLPDVDLAGITGNWVVQSGMKTDKDALALETAQNPIYAVTLTTLEGKESDPRIQLLYKLLRDDRVKQFIRDKYQGAVLPIP